jgi:cytochrome c biogenesis protein CcmG/thiol:disulfide interchange protein DsbE
MRRLLPALLVVVPLAGLMFLFGWKMAQGSYKGGPSVFTRLGEVPVQRAVPLAFTLSTLDGRTLTAAELNGQLVMVDFWASWCPPCREEARLLQEVWERYRQRGVVFVGVAIWDSEPEVRAFLERYGIQYPIALDGRGTMAVEYGVTGVPEKYFFDQNGVLRRRFVGPMTEAALTETLEALLTDTGRP